MKTHMEWLKMIFEHVKLSEEMIYMRDMMMEKMHKMEQAHAKDDSEYGADKQDYRPRPPARAGMRPGRGRYPEDSYEMEEHEYEQKPMKEMRQMMMQMMKTMNEGDYEHEMKHEYEHDYEDELMKEIDQRMRMMKKLRSLMKKMDIDEESIKHMMKRMDQYDNPSKITIHNMEPHMKSLGIDNESIKYIMKMMNQDDDDYEKKPMKSEPMIDMMEKIPDMMSTVMDMASKMDMEHMMKMASSYMGDESDSVEMGMEMVSNLMAYLM